MVGVKSYRVDATSTTSGDASIDVGGRKQPVRIYNMSMTFYNVSYSKVKNKKHPLRVKMTGGDVYMERIGIKKHPVRVFCSCPWFRFACEWYLADDSSLAPARKRRPYNRKDKMPPGTAPSPNPDQLPCICKHLYQLSLELQKRGVIESGTLQPADVGRTKGEKAAITRLKRGTYMTTKEKEDLVKKKDVRQKKAVDIVNKRIAAKKKEAQKAVAKKKAPARRKKQVGKVKLPKIAGRRKR